MKFYIVYSMHSQSERFDTVFTKLEIAMEYCQKLSMQFIGNIWSITEIEEGSSNVIRRWYVALDTVKEYVPEKETMPIWTPRFNHEVG
jgi:hypothetical protein